MSIPKYCIRLTGIDFEESSVSCTGQQLNKILSILSKSGDEIVWYLADVDTISRPKNWKMFETGKPNPIGATDLLIEQARTVEQFTSGVFLGVYKKEGDLLWSQEYETEDDIFIDNEMAEFEIRAFDTTYFEVYSSSLEVLENLSETYGCEIVKKTD